MLFHYHYWTPYLEETEKFYVDNGFRISLRMGKYQGEYQTFNPPLQWDDFREKDIPFRIIEARKGAINITFGYGKKVMFDHIGFLVERNEHDEICHKAKHLGWNVSSNERRTFIGTPYGFRIELQSNLDAIDGSPDLAKIEELELFIKSADSIKDISKLLNNHDRNIHVVNGDICIINKVIMSGILQSSAIDPNGVRVVRKQVNN